MNATQLSRLSSLGLAVVMAFAAATASRPVLADTLTDVPSVTFSYADLDVTTPQGTAALYRRIQSAAGKVCGFYPSRDLQRLQSWKNCYRASVDNAVSTVNLPQLAALHQGKLTREAAVAKRNARK